MGIAIATDLAGSRSVLVRYSQSRTTKEPTTGCYLLHSAAIRRISMRLVQWQFESPSLETREIQPDMLQLSRF